jgi:hypothetical protein
MNQQTALARKTGVESPSPIPTAYARPRRRAASLTPKEIQEALATQPPLPVFLSLPQAAALARLAPSTLKRKVSEGSFRSGALD